jgi:hypothetical protein
VFDDMLGLLMFAFLLHFVKYFSYLGALLIWLSNENTKDNLWNILCFDILEGLLFTSLLIRDAFYLSIAHELLVGSNIILLRILLVQETSSKVQDVEKVWDEDLFLKPDILRMDMVSANIAIVITVVHGDLPNLIEDEFTFAKANLSASNLILTDSGITFFLDMLNMRRIPIPLGRPIERASAQVVCGEDWVGHTHHLMEFIFLEARESLKARDILSVHEVLMRLNASFGQHGDAWPDVALLLREESDTHEVDFKSPHEEVSDVTKVPLVSKASIIEDLHVRSCRIVDIFAIHSHGMVIEEPSVKFIQMNTSGP